MAQTALELLDLGFRVQVPADAVASRHKIDWEFALRRLEQAGAVVSTTEAVLFEWTETADRPEFKAISELIKAMNRPAAQLTLRDRSREVADRLQCRSASRDPARSLTHVRRVAASVARSACSLSKRVLLGPGPSDVHPRVLEAHGHAAGRPPRPRVRGLDGRDPGPAPLCVSDRRTG